MAVGGYVVLAAGGTADTGTSNSSIQALTALGVELRFLVDPLLSFPTGDQITPLYTIWDGTVGNTHIKFEAFVTGDATGANLKFGFLAPGVGGLTPTATIAVSSLPSAGTFLVLWMYYTNGSQVITLANDSTSTVLYTETGSNFDGGLPVLTGNGRVTFNSSPNATKAWAMSIDGAAVYSVAKSGAAQYATPTVNDSGIVAFWRFDEQTGSTTADDLGGPSLTLTDYTWEAGGIWDASTTVTIPITGVTSQTQVASPAAHPGDLTGFIAYSTNVQEPTGNAPFTSVTEIAQVTAVSPTLYLSGVASATAVGTVTVQISSASNLNVPVQGVASVTAVGQVTVVAVSTVVVPGAATLQYILDMAVAFSTANTGLPVVSNVSMIIERVRSDQRAIFSKLNAQNRKRYLAVQSVTSTAAASARSIGFTGLVPAVDRVLQLVLADGRTVSIVDLLDPDGELAPRAYVFGPQLVEVQSDWAPLTGAVTGTLYYVQQPTDLNPAGDLTQTVSIPGDWTDLLIIPLAQFLAAQDTAPVTGSGTPRSDEIGVLQQLYDSRLQAFYSYCAHYAGTISSRFDIPRPLAGPR